MDTAADPTACRRALSQEADRLIADLHAAIRCLCCPVEGMFQRLLDGERDAAAESSSLRPALRRSDFLGMLAEQDIDSARGGAR